MGKDVRRVWFAGALKWAVCVAVLVALAFLVAPRRETVEPVLTIGFVDMTRLFSEYYETKKVTADFEAMFNDEEERLTRKGARARELKARLDDESSTLSEDERNELKEQLNEELSKLRFDRDATERRLRREKEKAERELVEKLQNKVSEYGTRGGYSMILSKSLLLHGAQSYDLTDDIIKFVNTDQ